MRISPSFDQSTTAYLNTTATLILICVLRCWPNPTKLHRNRAALDQANFRSLSSVLSRLSGKRGQIKGPPHEPATLPMRKMNMLQRGHILQNAAQVLYTAVAGQSLDQVLERGLGEGLQSPIIFKLGRP